MCINGLRSPFRNRGIGRGGSGNSFTLAGLFSGQSGFLPPFTAETLWQDAAGTNPVTTLDHPVAFAQDGSQGLEKPARRNLLTWAEDFSNAVWIKGGTNAPTVGAKVADPDGGLSATQISFGATSSTILQTIAVTAGASYTTSCWLRVSSGTASMRIGSSATVVGEYSDITVTTTWQRFSYTSVSSGTSEYPGVFNVGASASVEVWHPQFEPGTTATDYQRITSGAYGDWWPGNHGRQSGLASYRPKWDGISALSFDGIDDFLATTAIPPAAGTLGGAFDAATASRIIMGAQDASGGRCYLGIGSDGRLAGGIGASGMTTITGGGDLRGTGKHTGVLTWDGSTVTLYLDGAAVYSGAQSGAVTTTVPIHLGALNANGTAGSFHHGKIYHDPMAINRVLTAAEVAKAHTKWSA